MVTTDTIYEDLQVDEDPRAQNLSERQGRHLLSANLLKRGGPLPYAEPGHHLIAGSTVFVFDSLDIPVSTFLLREHSDHRHKKRPPVDWLHPPARSTLHCHLESCLREDRNCCGMSFFSCLTNHMQRHRACSSHHFA